MDVGRRAARFGKAALKVLTHRPYAILVSDDDQQRGQRQGVAEPIAIRNFCRMVVAH